ncbi:cell envelope integrity protein TolA [Alteromonas gilva]|uniref:Cell envelope integrity protein TolA n=1 Tax=Alteromonas gilva TaxID=2987522 RepID=A0ABT5L130_9ALTE|nr:cell envelope integrity protein TolA [Alteromonas gilva]MDC8830106.1 cell envelope integrity protein TolA [Alteromonas gilva]
MTTFAKAALLGSIISSTLISPVTQAQDLNELDRQLTIMSGVIETALKQDTRKNTVRYRSIDATYLAKQGVVFTINTGIKGRGFSFGQFVSSMPPPPPAPDAPHSEAHSESVHVIRSDNFEFITETDWAETAERVISKVERIINDTDDRLREFRSDHRELEWEMRELERRNRDLEFELRTADNERRKEVEAEIKEVEKEFAMLQSKEKQITEKAQALAAEKKAEMAKQKQAEEEAYKTFLANFEASIGDTLCSFGAGLRELPDNENITFVLDNFAMNNEGKTEDKVYIFSKKDVKRCVTEDISPSDILANAQVYSF